MPIFVATTRGVDTQGQFIAEPGPTRFLVLSNNATDYDPNSRSETGENWRDLIAAAAKRPKPNVVSGMSGDVLIFVHGYNNTTAEILQRTSLLLSSLEAQGWKGVVVAFDWPSDNHTLNYLEDRHDASAVAGRLVQEVLPLLVQAQAEKDAKDQPVCTINVHLLGHSTGAFVIMEAFSFAEKIGKNFKSDYRIGQVGFIGADVSANSLDNDCEWAGPMFRRISRLTNYSNGYDSVLAASSAKRLGVSPRAGRVGATAAKHAKVVNVDTAEYFVTKDPKSSIFVGTFCHSWHIGDPLWALDFALTLEGQIDRHVIPTRTEIPKLQLKAKGAARPPFAHLWESTAP